MYSPVGIWMLLCAALVAAGGSDRERLERAVGCPREETGELLEAFVNHVPEALKAAVALWARSESTTDAFQRWIRELPTGVDSGPMPSQTAANDWARRNTLGLIPSFPTNVDEMLVVLASAVATRVSWEDPFEIATARERFSPASPWQDKVDQVLCTQHTMHAALVDTDDAGTVAVFEAVAQEDLTVICVIADPAVSREHVFDAAHEIVGHIRVGAKLPARSLFGLPVGEAHSWSIAERERPAWQAGQRFETITERTAELRFDHPFAAIAVSGRPGTHRSTRFCGLPLFEAWIHSPTEAKAGRPRV